ncbi:uncharacterized protein C11orf42-like [Chiloscyllium punctatum]|uniref:uncharacterized protein C11orf42-like n=1 Tax=Chiloscyllium punctatum TaxID=137246 RepID=UPI003B63F093
MSRFKTKLEEINSRQADDYWVLVRQEVCAAYLGVHVVPVPFLVDAAQYELMNVILERSENVRCKIFRRKSFLPMGPLKEIMVDIDPGSMELMENNIEREIRNMSDFDHEELVIDEGVLKSIKLIVKEVNKEVALFMINPGTLKISHKSPWIYSVKHMYIICEVFYTTNIQLLVSDNQLTQQFKSKTRTPIGFLCKKFKLGTGGIMGIEMPLKEPLKNAHFVNISSSISQTMASQYTKTSIQRDISQASHNDHSLFRSILPGKSFREYITGFGKRRKLMLPACLVTFEMPFSK